VHLLPKKSLRSPRKERKVFLGVVNILGGGSLITKWNKREKVQMLPVHVW
jgi:hypothetical protein